MTLPVGLAVLLKNAGQFQRAGRATLLRLFGRLRFLAGGAARVSSGETVLANRAGVTEAYRAVVSIRW